MPSGLSSTASRVRPLSRPLSQATAGERLVIAALDAVPHAPRLRELGMGEGCEVRIVAASDPMICGIGCARIAVARRMAETIHVERPALQSDHP